MTLLKHRTVTTLRMIVCIPGARGVIKEPGAWISVVRSMYTICETALRWMGCWGPRTVYFALRASHVTLPTSSSKPQTSSVTPRASYIAPHTSARRNKRLLWQICRFLRYPKLGAVGVDGFGAPVNDNHYRYRLQTGTSMIIIVIYIHKPK